MGSQPLPGHLGGPWGADALLALVLLSVALAQLVITGTAGMPAVAGAAAMVVPVAWRRAAPLAAVVVAWAALLVQEGMGADITSQGYAAVIALMVLVYSLARHRARKAAALGLAAALACVWGSIPFSPTGSAPDYAFTGLVTVAPWMAGLVIRDRQLRIEQLAALNTELEEKHGVETSLAVLAERDRLAREMHDILTHTLSMMVVQLGGIQQIMASEPARAAAAIADVRASGKDALAELRTALAGERSLSPGAVPEPTHHGAVPRSRRSAGPGPSPGPGVDRGAPHRGTQGLARIPALLESMGRTGLSVVLHDPQDLALRSCCPAAVGHAALRIIQESLTNVLKHAPGSTASVELSATRHALYLTIMNTPAAPPPQPGSARGAGIRGMQERARLFGGQVTAGPAPNGGFAVHAELALEWP